MTAPSWTPGLCQYCVLFHVSRNECRAAPPVVVDESTSKWPTVKPSDWCGAYYPVANAPRETPSREDAPPA